MIARLNCEVITLYFILVKPLIGFIGFIGFIYRCLKYKLKDKFQNIPEILYIYPKY